jgi:hypothetical protein
MLTSLALIIGRMEQLTMLMVKNPTINLMLIELKNGVTPAVIISNPTIH